MEPGRARPQGRTRPAPRARGSAENPPNRFERIVVEEDLDHAEAEAAAGEDPRPPRTKILTDPSRTAIAFNDSPDIGFDASLNPYRGCEHGCSYCYARPTHEYLGLSAGLDFETRIFAKTEAPALLRKTLSKPSWKPQVVALSGVTDAYQPVEARLQITRRCLEVFAEFRNPVSIITKSALVARDADLLAELARFDAASVGISVTSLDRDLAKTMEPRAATPRLRLAAIEALAKSGVPVGALVAPVIPGLNDHEVPKIVEAVANAGAGWVSHVVLRLPFGLKDLFEDWLRRHFPEKADKVLGRVREVRGGKLYDSRHFVRQAGTGIYARQIHQLFAIACRRAGVAERGPDLSAEHFRRPQEPQLSLFEGI